MDNLTKYRQKFNWKLEEPMIDFYTRLGNGEGKSQALRHASRAKTTCKIRFFSLNFLHAEKDEKTPHQHFKF
jgi:hypothetical protein